MSWEQTTDMTKEERDMADLEHFVETAKVHESTMVVTASALYHLMLDLKQGRKIEDSLVRDIIRAALFMQHYADECGQLEFWMKTRAKRNFTTKELDHALPQMRVAAGQKASEWGEQLTKLLQRVDDASR